ncbi:ead/Ea22-like family protein [Citrobacter sp. RHBSTW-00029]|uniref:ead/Ea22-like family protein n=1 Tax=Citrobacter sp. RHBSTW-00029 TaxID=2742631 RepID=UPI0015FA449A|nr:ead/Ea22-like family protein [Citrobacter sp. RHBSTW-00029]MBA8105958.1 ead/Ea22-like family protein [Citrobacter sp. RHBSTW-00029]
MTALNKQALREAAVRAGGGKWIYIRTLSLSSAYITEETGATVINCTAGDVPAKCAGFLELANPATVLALLDELETKDKLKAELMEKQRLIDICQGQGLEHRISAEKRAEAAEKRIAELSTSHSKLRDTMAGIHNTIRMDGGYTPLAAILNAAKRAHEESATAAGIGVKGE